MLEKTQRAHAASLDPVTGLYDEWAIRLRVTEEIARARRYRYSVSLLLVTFPSADSRLVEERVLQLTEILEQHVRQADILARCDHDSLALLLPHTDEAGVRCLGERVHRLAMVMQLPSGFGGGPLPVQVGVTTVPQSYEGDGAAVLDCLKNELRCLVDRAGECCHFLPSVVTAMRS